MQINGIWGSYYGTAPAESLWHRTEICIDRLETPQIDTAALQTCQRYFVSAFYGGCEITVSEWKGLT